ncbi:MAG TPA: glutamate--tRNA ligase [Candidatus Acidoferrales bacterium]|nr:glutamate--tRNA ligase [Candidatus Acidoferrales bacterium]
MLIVLTLTCPGGAVTSAALSMNEVRTRFPPSPTGYLHIGGARTALFNYLFARHHGGRLVLRIEDTDRERSTEESVNAILDSMRWLGLDWDEGPFFQSQRTALYREDAERLLREGKAYRCYCSPEELEAKRQAALTAGGKPMYDRTCRNRSDVPAGRSFAVRFKAPLDGETVVADQVKGHVIFDNRELDDLIIMRSDDTPTYNFCVVVDDALMQITHIIRGDDHLANTPKQIQMYQALGYPVPIFAHIPLILGPDRTRLSKRHGATSVMAYHEMGYLPDALVNYLARLGWAYGDQEIFTRQELIEKFSLESVGKAAGVYNAEKAEWLNAHYIKAMAVGELAQAVKPYIAAKGYVLQQDDRWVEMMVKTLQERAKTLVELVEMAHFYLSDDITIDANAAAKHLRAETQPALQLVRDGLTALQSWEHDPIKACFDVATKQLGLGLGKIAQPVRVALTGGTVSPGIFEVLEVLGKQRSLARLDHALAIIGGGTTT